MKKQIIGILSSVFPNLFVTLAYNSLTNPQLRKLRANELATLNKAQQKDYDFKGFTIKTYYWKPKSSNNTKDGDNDKRILLIHGWEGQAGNFSDLIQSLLANGFTVYAFDGPSHGFSSQGSTSLFEFTELVAVMIRRFRIHKLISHSFGGVATTYALYNNPDIAIEKYALITTPDKFSDRINEVAAMIGIADKVKIRLIQKVEAVYNLKVNTLNVSDFVRTINVKKAFIIHDKNDRVIPMQYSKNVHNNWPVSTYKTVEGTGHFRILRTQSVINEVIEFIS